METDKGSTSRNLVVQEPELARIKSDRALAIYRTIQSRGLSQSEAATIMGVDQAKVSAIIHSKLKGITMERLLHCLNDLDLSVEIRVTRKPSRAKQAHTVVTGLAG